MTDSLPLSLTYAPQSKWRNTQQTPTDLPHHFYLCHAHNPVSHSQSHTQNKHQNKTKPGEARVLEGVEGAELLQALEEGRLDLANEEEAEEEDEGRFGVW